MTVQSANGEKQYALAEKKAYTKNARIRAEKAIKSKAIFWQYTKHFVPLHHQNQVKKIARQLKKKIAPIRQ